VIEEGSVNIHPLGYRHVVEGAVINLLLACNYEVYTVHCTVHCKTGLAVFPSPVGMSIAKLSLARNNLIIRGQGNFGDIPAGDGKTANLFFQCVHCVGYT
jgi:hypothetical protein